MEFIDSTFLTDANSAAFKVLQNCGVKMWNYQLKEKSVCIKLHVDVSIWRRP